MVYDNSMEAITSASLMPHEHKETSMHVSNNIGVERHQFHRLNANTIYNQHQQLEALSPIMTSTAAQHPPEPTSPYLAYDAMDDIILDRLSPWKRLVSKVDSKEDVIAAVRHFGLDSTANRLAYLDKLVEEDPEEEVIEMESLRRFAVFMLDRHLPLPKIGISPGGLVQAVWLIPDGILSMDFLPYDKVRFTAVLQDGKWSTRGILPPHRMIEEIEPFRKALYK